MYCPKCGTENPEDGSYCRKCGTDIAIVNTVMNDDSYNYTIGDGKKKKKEVSYETAFGKLFMGVAFLVVSFILGNTVVGTGWWFWMLIPGFAMLGSGVAHMVRLNHEGAFDTGGARNNQGTLNEVRGSSSSQTALPEAKTEFVPSERRYETGDLVPPSVVENTTRHLEMDKEGQTMSLPKNDD